MKRKKACLTALLIIGCILINCVGKGIARTFQLPVWMDAAGTVLAAYFYGPVCGAFVGSGVNVIFGFFYPQSYCYVLTSMMIGILVGVCAKRNVFRDLFGTLSVGFFVSVVSVIVSTPLNLLFFEGYTGNLWGDGVIDFLLEQGAGSVLSCAVGEFYVDFLDKTLLLCLLYAGVKGIGTMHKRTHAGEALKILLLAFLAGTMMFPAAVSAKRQESAEDYNTYVQTIYNSENSLPGGIATDIGQTEDGVLWIGTYNGLYRYSGTQFEWMNKFDSVKNVNCLFTDAGGKTVDRNQ